jgi:hypothetical protein
MPVAVTLVFMENQATVPVIEAAVDNKSIPIAGIISFVFFI